MAAPRRQIPIRIPVDDLAEIDRRAQQLGLTRSRYLIDSALDRIQHQAEHTNERLDQLETAVQHLQQYAYTTS